MKAKLYDLKVHDSILDQAHGFGYMIREIYIPELNLHINSKHSFLGEPPKEILKKFDPETGVKETEMWCRVPEKFEEIELNGEVANAATVLAKALEMQRDTENILRRQFFSKEQDE